jgi:hypothetical protein
VLFTEPLRAPRKETQAFAAPAKEFLAVEPVAAMTSAAEQAAKLVAAEPVAADAVATEPVSAKPAAAELVAADPVAIEPASAMPAAVVAKVFDRQAPAVEERSPAEAFAFAPAPTMPAAKPAALHLELRGNLSPEESSAASDSPATGEPERVEAAAQPPPALDADDTSVAYAVPIDDDPLEDGEAALSAGDPIETVAAPAATAALRGTDVAPVSVDASADDDAPAAAAGEAMMPWAEEALVCPRDWLEMTGTVSADEVPDGCGPKFVLVAPVPSAATEAPEEPSLDETLESAAATHALKLSGFVARLPLPRPDPPPVRRVSRNHSADWPASPPPNCGAKHAYWRFVDRKAGTKEWYCR